MTATRSPKHTATSEDRRERRKFVLLFLTLMLVMLLASLSQMVLASALPTLVGELNGVEHLSWVITAYLLATTVTMPIYGKLSDLVGRKPMLVVAVLLFMAGSIMGALSTDMNMLVVARVVQGLGGGGLLVLSQAAIADVVPARDRGKYMGYLSGAFALSSVAGPLLGGWFTQGPGWRWTFWINVPLGLVAVIAIVILMNVPHQRPSERARIDVLGMVLLTIATAGVVLVASWGGSYYAWDSLEIIALAIGTVIASVLFVFVERHVGDPVIPMRLFADRNFTLMTVAGLLVSVPMFGAIGYMPTYFQMSVGATATQSGLLMIPMMALMLLTSVVTGVVISRTGRYKAIPVVGTVVVAIGLVGLATVTVDTELWLTCVWTAVIGFGLGTSMQIMTLVVQNSFAHREVGTATAAHNFFRQVGGSLGTAIIGSIFSVRLAELLAEKIPAGMALRDRTESLTPAVVAGLPDTLRLPVIEAYNDALMPVFLLVLPLALASVVLFVFVVETPLATVIEREIPAEALSEGQLLLSAEDDVITKPSSDTWRSGPQA